jgi:hypothetical protein
MLKHLAFKNFDIGELSDIKNQAIRFLFVANQTSLKFKSLEVKCDEEQLQNLMTLIQERMIIVGEITIRLFVDQFTVNIFFFIF